MHIPVVDVAIDSAKPWAQGLEAVGQFHTADVARMPNLVALPEVNFIFIIPEAVGVADDANLLHKRYLSLAGASRPKRLRMNVAINRSVSSMPNKLELMQRS